MHSINKNYFNWFQLFDCVFANYSIKIANGWRATSVENKSVYFPPPELQASNASQYDRVVSNDGSRPIFGTTCDCHFMLRWKTKSFFNGTTVYGQCCLPTSSFQCVLTIEYIWVCACARVCKSCLLACVRTQIHVCRLIRERTVRMDVEIHMSQSQQYHWFTPIHWKALCFDRCRGFRNVKFMPSIAYQTVHFQFNSCECVSACAIDTCLRVWYVCRIRKKIVWICIQTNWSETHSAESSYVKQQVRFGVYLEAATVNGNSIVQTWTTQKRKNDNDDYDDDDDEEKKKNSRQHTGKTANSTFITFYHTHDPHIQ